MKQLFARFAPDKNTQWANGRHYKNLTPSEKNCATFSGAAKSWCSLARHVYILALLKVGMSFIILLGHNHLIVFRQG